MKELIQLMTPEAWAHRLEDVFSTIWHERMADIPIINNQLKVEATGFHRWNGKTLGVLVTPWFMNLMILPDANDPQDELRVGTKRSFAFDAGVFEFIVGEEPELGKFMSCSMFSPMFEFESHEAAMATADAVIEELFDAENQEVFTPQSLGDDPVEDTALSEGVLEGVQVISETTQKNMEQPITRRDLLRGSFLRVQKRSENQERSEKC